MLTIKLPEKMEKKLANLSLFSKRPAEFFIKEALTAHWEDLADIAAVERYESTPTEQRKHYSSEEVDKLLGFNV